MKKRISEFLSSTAGPVGGSTVQPMMLKDPLVVMFQNEDKTVTCHIHPGEHDHRGYGLLICDLVRHVANAFKVDEDDVWEWVDKERARPTTQIIQPS